MTIIWCMASEIWSTTDIIFCHFGFSLFQNQNFEKMEINTWRYYHFTHANYKWHHMMYGSWNMEWVRLFMSFWVIFSPFTVLPIWKIKILKKWKKMHLNHVYYEWQSYHVWSLRYGAQQKIFLSFWTIICPLEISSCYRSVAKIMIICYTVPEIWHLMNIIIFHFGLFLAIFPSIDLKNQNFEKMKINVWRYHHFTYMSQKLWSNDAVF